MVKKIVNNVEVDLTAEDIAQRETDAIKRTAKLIAGEALTEDEADTIVI